MTYRRKTKFKQPASVLVGAIACIGAVWWWSTRPAQDDVLAPEWLEPAAILESQSHDREAFLERFRLSTMERAEARRLMESMRFSDEERVRIDAAVARKLQSHARLMKELTSLHAAIMDENTPESTLRQGMDDYRKISREVREEVATIDEALAQQLSARAEARLMVVGIVDNGLGLMSGKLEQWKEHRASSAGPGELPSH